VPVRNFAAYAPGILPRSEDLVAATRDLERGRTMPRAVDELFDRERDAAVSLQREAGLDYVSDGLLRWQDLFRPLVEATRGGEARALVRWFDTNSFFRAPEWEGRPELAENPPGVFALSGRDDGPRVATLPSPFLFSRAARSSGHRNELMEGLARDVLGPVAGELAGHGHEVVHLQEPWLPFFGIDDGDWPRFERSIAAIREAAPDATLVLHAYFGDVAPFADRLTRLPVDAVGVDLVETDAASLPSPWPVGLAAGSLDGRRSVVEPAEETVAFVEELADRLEPPSLFLIPNGDLQLLGPVVAERKLRLLGEAAARLREAA
jgi:5-methyltetrahydropteroyltriglutamate--homocysteine methyltransferase